MSYVWLKRYVHDYCEPNFNGADADSNLNIEGCWEILYDKSLLDV